MITTTRGYPNSALRVRNDARQAAATARIIDKARHAIVTIEANRNALREDLQEQYLTALRARVTQSDATVAEIADSLGMTKDRYWSQLRRGMQHATRIDRKHAQDVRDTAAARRAESGAA